LTGWLVRIVRRYANAPRKISCFICRLRTGIDVHAALQIGEWQAVVEPSGLVEILRYITAGEDFPAERQMILINL